MEERRTNAEILKEIVGDKNEETKDVNYYLEELCKRSKTKSGSIAPNVKVNGNEKKLTSLEIDGVKYIIVAPNIEQLFKELHDNLLDEVKKLIKDKADKNYVDEKNNNAIFNATDYIDKRIKELKK